MKQFKTIVYIFFVFPLGCNPNEVKYESKQPENIIEKPECQCKENDTYSAAYKVVEKFEESQQHLESQYVNEMKIDKIEKGGNCTYLVTFKISNPLGDRVLDPTRPTRYITKRFYCDNGKINPE